MKNRIKYPRGKSAVDPLAMAMDLYNKGSQAKSEILFKKIYTVAPNNGVVLYYLALISTNKKNFIEALQFATLGTTSIPNFAPLWLMRASAHNQLHETDKSLECYDKALLIDPKSSDALVNSGVILHDLHRHSDSLQRFRNALDINDNNVNALANYGIVLSEMRLIPEAIEIFERLLEVKPNYSFGLGLLTYERMHICDWDNLESETELITAGIHSELEVCKTLGFMALSDAAADHFQCGKIFAAARFSNRYEPVWKGEQYIHDKIRIAYISPDLREHPVGHLMAGVIENHDRSRFEITCISIGADDNSDIRARLCAASDNFIYARSMSAHEIAELIKKMEVDIAIDLAGYTTDSRTDIFLHRPAPVQVNYLGYPGTMALDCYDYIIADRTVLPPEQAGYYSEKPAYLDYCYLPIASGVEVAPPMPRSEYGLPEHGFVFCAFSHDYKIHPKVFDMWMQLLQGHPGSVIWLMSRNDATQKNLRREALSRGIDPQRLVFASRVPRIEDHLARYRAADLFLDTWPYNAHTTAADALLTGLPVVTYKGQSFPSRVAASLLESLDMPELATDSFAHYFETANTLAGDPEKLQAVRDRLSPERLKTHPFFGEAFTQRLEKLFRSINVATVQEPDGGRTTTTRKVLAMSEQIHGGTSEKVNLLQEAILCFQKRNYPQAEFFARECLLDDSQNIHALQILVKIRKNYNISEIFRLSETVIPEFTEQKFILIKSWGYGFWSDVHHVATQLLVAELTHRKPIVLWGSNCLFRNLTEVNAVSNYFPLLSKMNLDDIPIGASFYPPKWNAYNLREEDVNKWSGTYSRVAAPTMFARNETVVVSDFYSTLNSIMPWIDTSSKYFGKSEDAIYSEVLQKYFTVSSRIQMLIDDFYVRKMLGRNWVAVHIRGSDKINESPHLAKTNAEYIPFLERIITLNPNIGIFLLTDSQPLLDDFYNRYGDRLLTTQANRSSTANGIHMSGLSGHSLGDEVLIDAMLATRCDYLVGNIESNVSLAISSLKSWPSGFIFMLGKESVRGKNSALHRI